MNVSLPGKYHIQEDVHGSLSMTGDGIELYGHGFVIHGPVIISGSSCVVSDLIIRPPTENDMIIGSNGNLYCLSAERADKLYLKNVHIESPIQLDFFASETPSKNKEDKHTLFINCLFYKDTFSGSGDELAKFVQVFRH